MKFTIKYPSGKIEQGLSFDEAMAKKMIDFSIVVEEELKVSKAKKVHKQPPIEEYRKTLTELQIQQIEDGVKEIHYAKSIDTETDEPIGYYLKTIPKKNKDRYSPATAIAMRDEVVRKTLKKWLIANAGGFAEIGTEAEILQSIKRL